MTQTKTQIVNSIAVDGEQDICAKLPSKIGTDPNFKRKIVWFNVIGFAFLHAAALYGLYLGVFYQFATFCWSKE